MDRQNFRTLFVVPFCSLNQGAEAQGPSPETRRGTPLQKRAPLSGKVPLRKTRTVGYPNFLCWTETIKQKRLI